MSDHRSGGRNTIGKTTWGDAIAAIVAVDMLAGVFAIFGIAGALIGGLFLEFFRSVADGYRRGGDE